MGIWKNCEACELLAKLDDDAENPGPGSSEAKIPPVVVNTLLASTRFDKWWCLFAALSALQTAPRIR